MGGLAWIVHAVRSCLGQRASGWLFAWLIGLPLMCLTDYVVFLVSWGPSEGGIAEASPGCDQLVVNLFAGLALWVLLLLLEPALLLVDAGVRRSRRRRSRHADRAPEARAPV